MKTTLINVSKQILADRPFLLALVALVFFSLVFCVYVTVNLHPSELQVVTHYSAFGTTNFYRDKWFYLAGFIVFGLMNAVIYGALACKIFVHKGRALAIPFAWLGAVMIVVASAVVYQLLKIAALS